MSKGTGVKVRLSVMMFLQYAIWGAWLPLLWPFLTGHRGFTPSQVGDIFAIGAVGAIVAPFVAGQIADRYFSTQRFLGISHILGGVLVWQLATLEGYWWFLGFSLVYSLIYSPTLSLTNSISFHHLPNRDKDFGKVRLWGTIGWICVGIGIGQWLLHSHTVPRADAARSILVERLSNEDERARLLSQSRVVLTSGAAFDAVVNGTTMTFDARVLPAESANALKIEVGADSTPSRVTLDIPADDIKSITPLYSTLAAPESDSSDDTSPTASPADAMRALIESLQQAPDEAARAGLLRDADAGALVHPDLTAARITRGQQEGMSGAFRVSAVLGIAMGIYCFTLPHTPPTRGRQKNATWQAIEQVRNSRGLLVLFLLLVPVSCIHQFYFVHTSGFLQSFQSRAASTIDSVFGVGGGGLMTIGQMAEIGVLALMPLLLPRLSRKALLAIGLLAYAGRMAIFAYVGDIHAATGIAQVPILMVGVALHGVCFGAFIFVSFVVVDELTTKDVRASAQSLFSLVIFGIGIIVGSKVAGDVASWAQKDGQMDYTRLFAVPMWASLGCLLFLIALFPRRPKAATLNATPENASSSA
ncbi:MAG: MFS transporter [Phycisphaeraceae bacterium]|nr:MFS transporter [Phycisphaeraceae bacterium]MCW5754995.1 MFS transporter [Phycisphaeraceae bacterium]